MARTHYTDSQKAAFVKAWIESRQPKSRWHKEQVEAGNIEGHYNAFSQWIDKYEKGELGHVLQQAASPVATQQAAKPLSGGVSLSAVGRNSSLMAEFQQSLMPEDVQAKYIAFLEGKVATLISELESVQTENANLHALIEKLEAPQPENE